MKNRRKILAWLGMSVVVLLFGCALVRTSNEKSLEIVPCKTQVQHSMLNKQERLENFLSKAIPINSDEECWDKVLRDTYFERMGFDVKSNGEHIYP